MRGRSPHDAVIGRQIRRLREAHGMSQAELGGRLGISFQQVQKYERGTNRISAGRLFEVAQILDVAVSRFYDGLGETGSTQPAADATQLLESAEMGLLLRNFLKIKEPAVRKQLIDLMALLVSED